MARSGHGHCGETNAGIALCLTIILTTIVITNATAAWYQGCISHDADSIFTPADLSIVSQPSSGQSQDDLGATADSIPYSKTELLPVRCSRKCLLDGSQYAGLVNGSNCLCGNSSNQHGRSYTTSSPNCNISCREDTSLPCGGVGGISVYSVQGPYLLTSQLKTEERAVTNDVVTLVLLLDLASSPQVKLGVDSDNSSNTDWGNIKVIWEIGDQKVVQNVTTQDSKIQQELQHNFTEPATYTIVVTASNGLSSIISHATQTVVYPAPHDLNLILITDSKFLPSCTPSNITIPTNQSSALVFEESLVKFEVAVAIGTDLHYNWTLNDGGNSIVLKQDVQVPPCSDANCKTSFLEYAFSGVGKYELVVTVVNIYGSLQTSIHIFVLERKISHLHAKLADGVPALTSPHQVTRFSVSMVTTDRQGTYLEVDFGDGDQKKFMVQDSDGSLLPTNHDGVDDFLHLTANYGDGCVLQMEVEHTYKKEGDFSARFTAYSNYSNYNNYSLVSTTSGTVTIVNALRGAALNLPSAKAVGILVTILLRLQSTSVGVSYYWHISGSRQNVQHNITTSVPHTTHTFTHPDIYTVEVVAINRVNWVKTSGSILIQQPVTGLVLSRATNCTKNSIKTGEEAYLTATVTGGSEVNFSWNLDHSEMENSKFTHTNNFSSVNHAFTRNGLYNISVQAYNRVSSLTKSLPRRLIVENPVGGLTVSIPLATETDKTTDIVVTASKGTNVMFDFDLGSGRIHFPGSWKGDAFSIPFTSSDAKVHNIRVYAYNNVSSMDQMVDIDVQNPVSMVIVNTYTKPVVGIPTVFGVFYQGEIQRRDDIIYTWRFDDQIEKHTRVPFVQKRFMYPGNVTVFLTARNLVSEFHINKTVMVKEPSRDVYFMHSSSTKLGLATDFSVQNTPAGEVNAHFGTGDGSNQSLRYTSPPDQGIQHSYIQTGIYAVSATVTVVHAGSLSNVTLRSVLSIQQEIAGLQLQGPLTVALGSVAAENTWQADLTGGSYVTYTWTFEQDIQIVTTSNKARRKFVNAGSYLISTTASNDVSKMSKSMRVIVQHPISKLEIKAPPTIQGRDTTVIILIHGGKDFQLNVDYSDGDSVLISSLHTNITVEDVPSPQQTQVVPIYKVTLKHRFSDIGQYNIIVNASNFVSWTVQSKMASVEEPISGINLTTTSPAVIDVKQEVKVTAIVATGKDLVFRWNFEDTTDHPNVVSNGKTSVATYAFLKYAKFDVSVSVSNALYQQPIIVRLPFSFHVVQPISDLYLTTSNQVFVAALKQRGIDGIATDVVMFEASILEGTDVKFQFDYADGTSVEEVEGTFNPFTTLTKATGQHAFRKVGTYNVSVKAVNPQGSQTEYRQLFVQYAASGLKLDRQEYSTRRNVRTTFVALIEDGTDVIFKWNMGDGSSTINTKGNSVSHEYWNAGKFKITVAAENKVSVLRASAWVYVQEAIQSVDLTTKSHLIKRGTWTWFTATAYPINVPGLVKWYKWDFGDRSQKVIGYSNSQSHRFMLAKKYFVKVSAHNSFSNATSKAFQVHVVEEMTNLRLTINGELIFKKELKFNAYTYTGTDIIYIWDFGDGSPIINSTSNFITHVYERKGKFRFHLFMSNPLGNISHTQNIFVLKKSCRQPVINILGSNGRKIYRSSEIKIEADVTVNCTITSSAEYTWMLKNGTDGTNINLQSLTNKTRVFNDSTLYLPERSLFYGNYTLKLKVRMKGEIVETVAATHFQVVPTPLLAVISGGIQRQVSRSDDIIMDALMSSDPDFPEVTEFNYTWTCYELTFPNKTCFGNASMVNVNGRTVRFSGRLLNLDEVNFVFNLTFSRHGRGSVSTSQVIRVKEGRVLDVQVVCPQCDDAQINADERLVLHADCPGCDVDSLQYEWELYKVADGSDDELDLWSGYHSCVEADGSTWKLVYPNKTTTTSAQNITTTGVSYTTTTITSPSNVDVATTTSTSKTTKEDPYGQLPSEGGEGGGRGSSRNPDNSRSGGNLQPGGGMFPFSGGPGMLEEGNSGSRSDTNGRGGLDPALPGGGPTEGEGEGRHHGSGNTGDETTTAKPKKSEVDPVVDDKITWRLDPHIVSKIRYSVPLKPKETTTGINQKTLVLRPGALHQGNTYMLQVTIKQKG